MSSLLAANSVDAAALADELARFRVVEPTRLAGLLSEFQGGEREALAEFLICRGVLTNFQAEYALAGKSRAIALGPYRLTGLAGSNIFGPLYSAIRLDKPGDFRLSIFPLRSLWRARQARQIARTFSARQHAAIVPLLDVDSANGFHFLVWPHIDGDSLMERVATSGPLHAGETISLLAHLADALHSCHLQKSVHGALTPHSILLDRNATPRLLELGAGAILAANLGDDESLLDSLSASVAATELLKVSAPEYVSTLTGTPASDQYALGAIGYYMLTGEAPFATMSLTNWLAAKAAGQPYPLSEVTSSISTELASTIDRMLRNNPEDRFSGLNDVQDRLAAISFVSPPIETPSSTDDQESVQDLPLFGHGEPARVSESISWTGTNPADIPGRDNSDASITFELPPPNPEVLPQAAHHQAGQNIPPAVELPNTPRQKSQSQPVRRYSGIRSAIEDAEEGMETPVIPQPPFRTQSQGSATPPANRMSPQSEDLHMATPSWIDPFERVNDPLPVPQNRKPGPRNGVTTPVHYHTETAEEAEEAAQSSGRDSGERPITDSVLWKKVKRSLLFWQAPLDVIRVSVYGPASVAPGQPAKISVFLHTPNAEESVKTLSRAFHHDSELIGAGFVAQEVARTTELAVHLSVANAGVSKSLLRLTWRGQPDRLVFDLHVPWESPSGRAPGLVSIGRENTRIGKVEFWLTILPRRG
jgi:serine/threonine protein kinase